MKSRAHRFTVLSASILSIGMSMGTYANQDLSTEVEQLRQEVQELRALIAQQAQTSQNIQQSQKNIEKQVTETKAAAVAPIVKNSSGAEFKFYGNIRADASYQAEGGSATRMFNQISSVPLEGNAESSDQFKSTLSSTRLGLDVKTNVGGEDINGKIEADFLGGANFDTLRIRHAYLNYGSWLVGQTWSNFAGPEYMAESIDALGYVGGAVKRTPQIRYQYNVQPSTHVVVALEDPKDTSINLRLPALTARLNQSFADNAGMLSLRGMVNEKKTSTDETTAWGAGLGVKYNFTPATTVKADYYHVKGDSAFVSWANQGIVKDAAQTIVAENEFDSITVGLTQQFNPQWRGTVGYGYMKADVDNDYKKAVADLTTVNKELWQAWANVFYSPTKPLSFGLEYVYGEREAVAEAANGSKTGEDNRVNAVAIYSF